MAKNWMLQLDKMDGAVKKGYDRFANVIETPSPSVNFSFGKGFGLPRGYSAVWYGPPKGGKTLLTNATIGKLHRDDPEAYVIKFDTELRDEGQLTEDGAAQWGIDLDRYKCYLTNNPMEIFDRIATEIHALCDDGMPLALIVIDSLTGIQGRRSLNAESIETQMIGDEALTIQTGLKRILQTQRKHNIAVIMTAHVRAEMDQLEQKRGNKFRMAASFGTQHHAEYFLFIEQNRNAAARVDLEGKSFESEVAAGVADNKNEVTGHKIRTVMKASSMGPAGRVGEFTINYKTGIINVHEEVFQLGVNRGIIQRPNNRMYVFAGREYDGKASMLHALRDYPELASQVIKELKTADLEGRFAEPVYEESASQE